MEDDDDGEEEWEVANEVDYAGNRMLYGYQSIILTSPSHAENKINLTFIDYTLDLSYKVVLSP